MRGKEKIVYIPSGQNLGVWVVKFAFKLTWSVTKKRNEKCAEKKKCFADNIKG